MSSLLHKPIRMRRCSGCNTSEAKEFDPEHGGYGRMEASKAMYPPYTGAGGEEVPSFPIGEGRRSKRVILKRRASVVVNLDRDEKRIPCIVLDSSKEGFRLRGKFPPETQPSSRNYPRSRTTRLSTLQSGLGRHSWLQAGRRGRPGNRLVDWKIACPSNHGFRCMGSWRNSRSCRAPSEESFAASWK